MAVPVWHQWPGGFPESHWSLVYVGSLKKLLMSVKKCRSRSNRIDRLASKSEGKQAKNPKSFHLPSLFLQAATRRCGPDLGWVFLLQMIHSRKPLTGVLSYMGFSEFCMQPILVIRVVIFIIYLLVFLFIYFETRSG